MLKTRRFGYDGKGQAMIRDGGDPVALFNDLGGQPQILEAFVPFETRDFGGGGALRATARSNAST